LWGQVKVKVDGVQLSDSQGRKIVSVRDAGFYLPFTSLLAGAPTMNFRMDQPQLNVVKDKSGKLNVMTLMKESAPPAQQPSAEVQVKTGTPGKSSAEIPAIATRARLGIELRDATIVYDDKTTDLKNTFDKMNVVLKNLSLSAPMNMHVF